MKHEEYFPQCCHEATEFPQISMMLSKEMLSKAANDDMENNARIYPVKKL